MSITGSLLTYKNKNHIVNETRKRSSNICSSNSATSHLINIKRSMGKTGPSANLSISENDSNASHKHQNHPYFKGPHLPAKYMNSKRKHVKYNSMYNQLYPDHNNYLHLNSLWSIWYGVLVTLFQGYLAVHGASRFLGCSLISWKIEPVAELNMQIILSGLVFVLLPFFFTSAVFKVGNMANDGLKLGSASKERLCTMVPHDGLEEESRGGTLRALWTHGAPTAAFVHILIAICLLLPRLLLEGRIIENGLLPKETIWRTELDFVSVNRRNLIVLSLKSSPYQNITSVDEDENYFNNDTIITAQSKNNKIVKNFVDNNPKQTRHAVMTVNGKSKYFELSDLVGATIKENINNSIEVISKYAAHTVSTVSPYFSTTSSYDGRNANTANVASKIIISTTDKNYISTNIYDDIETIVDSKFESPHSTQKSIDISKNFSELILFTSLAPKHNSYHDNQQRLGQNYNNGKTNRKHHRQRKVVSPLTQRKNHQHYPSHQKSMKSFRPLKDWHNLNYGVSDKPTDLSNQDENNFRDTNESFIGGKVYEHRPISYEVLDNGHARASFYSKSLTTPRSTIRDSNIHIVKPEKLPEIIPSTPLSSNSKIIEIKQKNKIKREIVSLEANHVEIEPEYLIGEFSFNDSKKINSIESSKASGIQSAFSEYNIVRLDGFAGMLQLFFGVEKPIDVNAFSNPPSAEFINLLLALLVWCVRYPAVFWTTAKSFATIFSVQMIASAADIIFSFVGISSLFKLQIYGQGQPIQNSGLILNAGVTLALYLLSVILILSSSMVLYLYGHGRLLAKMRDRSIISLRSNESWIYFAHCASMCYILAICVVKAPLLNDLSATYRNNLHCPTFMAALVSVMDIFLWIIIWIGLAAKRKWSFKLPPLDSYTVIGKSTTQPLLMHDKRNVINITTPNLNNSTTMDISSTSASEATESKIKRGNSGNLPMNTSTIGVLNVAPSDDVYWPKIMPSSPKLKVTFNEVTSTSDDDHRRIGEDEQNDGKRYSPRGTSICFTSAEGEIDDGEYATLRSGAATIVGISLGGGSETKESVNFSKNHILTDGVKVLHLSEYDELPPPPPNMTSSMTITNHTTTVTVNSRNTYEKKDDDCVGEDNISEEGKLLESVQDDSVTYASTRGLEPPLPPPPPKISYLVSPLVPVRVSVHTNEALIAPSSTPRCLRRVDSGVPQEALTPKSDTESTISPPERAPSESSSGIHSAEEKEIEVIIRPRIASKPIAKLPPAIQEEPNGRCTNMRMSSFAGGCNANSATLPLQRSNADQKFDYSLHCCTMPLPINSQNHNEREIQNGTSYATSEHCMSKTQSSVRNVSSFKTPLYANSGVAMSGHNQLSLRDQNVQTRLLIPPPQQVTHITLSNGIRYSNILRRQPLMKAADSQHGHQTFSKISYENSLASSTIHEDRDSANYSMISDQESLYAAANYLH